MDKLTLRMCSWNFSVKDDLINFELNWNPEVSIKSRSSTAFLIRITDWMSELHEYRMMFMLEMMSTFEIQIVESDRPIWLALFFADNGLHFLKNIQSNPTNPNCSYNFLVIGPPGKDADGDYPYYDWYEEKQELCDGTAIVTSQAYYDALHTPDAAYVLNRNIFCNEESIDVIVELIGILDDLPLNITCYDSERNIVNL
ncbi:unnamed protein product, partial [Mesorhabditis belari]|uniref:Uncharacterized protein n=1 Tax=Mesorhabditis belari TaxID=2138241 RepID=A0AAF3J508_9BILA